AAGGGALGGGASGGALGGGAGGALGDASGGALGGPLQAVPVNALIGAEDRAGASRAAAEAVRAGFRCVKVKVATGNDAGRLAAVRAAAGPDVAIRVDANGAWTVEEAVAALGALAPVGIELCEEPVHGVEALRAVRAAVDVPIAMDETASREPGAAGSGATDAVCLKVAALGGLGPLLEAAAAARAAGSDVYLASTFDGPAGIAAALHAAAALRVTRPCGLATLSLFADAGDPFPPRDGSIAVPDLPGLGPRPPQSRT
ncbi:MAG TPA: enolase C-terminal domain-like protein, partial [Solirubrobacteraceae bacterium]|nr:enolase C-terminal domain-like protein [Solirubrobacteraceae bacterium]